MGVLEIRDALKPFATADIKVSHFRAPKNLGKYIVWSERGQDDTPGWADNVMRTQIIIGTVDYFTPDEYDPNVDKIQTALNDAGISFSLPTIEYIVELDRINYQWKWAVPCEVGEMYSGAD
jgi:hypothetical protein